jgi:Ca2+-binding RTX toxin-like protein
MEGTGGIFTDILIDDGVTTKPVTGETFRPTDFQVGFALRVRAVYKDANDVIEEVFSAPTAPVIGINDAPVGTVLINDTTPTETQAVVALIAFTDADAPVDLVGGGVPPPIVYNYQWQQANDPGVGGGAAGFTNIAGATAQAFTPTEAQVNHELRVVVSYIDGQGFAEQVLSAPTVVTGDFFVGGGGNDVWIGTEGQDIASGNGGNDIFSGLGGDDVLNGNAGADVLDGDSGNDLLTGGTGNDALNGGDGNDTFMYTIGDGADGVNGGADVDTLQVSGTGGNDTLDVLFDEMLPLVVEGGALADVESVTADLLGGIDTLSYAGTTNVNVTANLTTGTASGFTALANIENLIGGNGHNTLIGDGLGNVLTGETGDDTLSGAAGDDTFLYTIGQGADAVDGGADADTLQITGTAAANTLDVIFNGTALTNVEGGAVANVEVVTANLGGGRDTVHYGATTAPVTVNLATGTASGFTSITNIENVTSGVGNDTLTGSTGAAILNTLNDGAGDDTYIVDGGETVIEAAGGGTDTVLSSAASFTLGANVENLTLTGTGNSNGTGNGAANVLTGNVGDNVLSGAAGNDTQIGDAGDDTLIGDTGNDTFNYTIGQGADAVDGGADTDTLTITGTAVANTLNVLFNGTALTTFAGGTVTGVEVVTADLGGGVDTVNYGATTASVTADLATGTASGFTSITNIENVTAGVGNDTLTGDANANTLNGGAGNDILHITAGNDILNGGAGNDVFVFDAPAFDSTINGFDANPVGGQDLLDISARGITAATFATAVNITAEGTGTMIDFGDPAVAQFHLVGVNAAAITATDFILAS